MADFSKWSRESLESLARDLTKETLSQRAKIQKMQSALMLCVKYIESDETTHGRTFEAGNAARAALGSHG